MVKEDLHPSSVYFTIDFEDFTYDLCKFLGASKTPKLRNKSLLKCFYNIQELLDYHKQNNRKITFFCTGIVADRYPEIIKLIAEQGHEIACHGNTHNNINGMSAENVYMSLKVAKEKLSEIAKTEVKGFRAPNFSIDKYDFERLDAIAKVFDYDSSLHFSNKKEFEIWKQNSPINLVEFPVPEQKILSSRFKVKPGGSYLKLFPSVLVRRVIYKSIKKSLTPIIYLHPYDIFYGYDLLVKWSELSGAKSRIYWYLRQTQWMAAFNWNQRRKLDRIFSEFNNIGRLGDRLSDA